ncbi:MAG: hypothetical protein KC609_09350 [Myxococcales bacterium]|nr:hypothetical protein [Myxococcales bacterium]
MSEAPQRGAFARQRPFASASPGVGHRRIATELLRERLLDGGSIVTSSLGVSMEPALRSGVELRVERCALDSLRRGDIVCLDRGDQLVAHRLIALVSSGGRRWFLTRGDNNLLPDRPLPEPAYLGRVTGFRSPAGGDWSPPPSHLEPVVPLGRLVAAIRSKLAIF